MAPAQDGAEDMQQALRTALKAKSSSGKAYYKAQESKKSAQTALTLSVIALAMGAMALLVAIGSYLKH